VFRISKKSVPRGGVDKYIQNGRHAAVSFRNVKFHTKQMFFVVTTHCVFGEKKYIHSEAEKNVREITEINFKKLISL